MGKGKHSAIQQREKERGRINERSKKKIRAEENAFMATKLGKSFFNDFIQSVCYYNKISMKNICSCPCFFLFFFEVER